MANPKPNDSSSSISREKGLWFFIIHEIVKDIPLLAMEHMQVMKAGPKCGLYLSDTFSFDPTDKNEKKE
ncbi:MAG: hypothetical protein ACTSRW_12150 [Candidatus Helarchaeota archaeon]